MQRIKKKEYDSDKGTLLTYITPYLKASMREYIGQNSSLFKMSGKTFRLISKCRALDKRWLSDEEIAGRLGISPRQVRAYLRFSLYHSVIVNGDTEEIGFVSESTLCANEQHPDDIVYWKWCKIYTRELFEQLSKREKYVIGSHYGVFGYNKMTAESIGEMLTKTRDAVMKDIDSILLKLREIYYEDSNLYRWRRAHRLVRNAAGE
jgi:DNA-directed RNA polymerase sigma subunit (sigma70/sigma32)